MRACWLKWVGRDWSISADYIWLNYSGANRAVEAMGGTTCFSKFTRNTSIRTIDRLLRLL